MELAICSTCQLMRRAGKRFAVAKVNSQQRYIKNEHMPVIPCKSLPLTQAVRQHLPSAQGSYLFSPILKREQSLLSLVRNLHTTSLPENWLTSQQIEDFLAENKIEYRKGFTGYLTKCFDCQNKKRNVCGDFNLFIDSRTGNATCCACGRKYSWTEFKARISLNTEQTLITETPFDEAIEIDDRMSSSHPAWLASAPIDEQVFNTLQNFQDFAWISLDTFDKFGIRTSVNSYGDTNLLFPYFDITRQKLLGFKEVNTDNRNSMLYKSDANFSLFGWNLIYPHTKVIVLTSNELDSMAITQYTNTPSLALPLGHLPPNLLPFLEQFEKIILWFPDDYQSKQNVKCFANKLNLARCFTVDKNLSGVVDYIKESGNRKLQSVLHNSRRMLIERVLTFKDLSNELYCDLINAKENSGIGFKRFPLLNDYLKGHRRGELTVFTGPTGSGKTTFLSELSLDLCTQGVNTLWGSFEIKNVRLANIMMHQFSGLAIEHHMDKFGQWYKRFEELPMYFMSYFGAQDLDSVISTIEHAVYMYDVEHVIIDNLQFMTSFAPDDDRFQALDRAVARFRKCASDFNVHVTVVVHPRKENDDSVLQTSSIYGTAKASQEADNVLILQRIDDLTIQIKKNRFNGAVGTVPLRFHQDSLCLSGFYRNSETDEPVLPKLKPIRPIQSLSVRRY